MGPCYPFCPKYTPSSGACLWTYYMLSWLALKVFCSSLMASRAAICSSLGVTEPRELTRSATLAPLLDTEVIRL